MKVTHQFQHFLSKRRTERSERFIEQQHRTVAYQDSRKGYTLTLAAGQFGGQPLAFAGKPRLRHGRLDIVAILLCQAQGRGASQPDIAGDIEMPKQVVLLKHH